MTNLQKQLLLAYMGLLEVKDLDGIWGPISAKATQTAQKQLGLIEDGIWGDQTEAGIREYVFQNTGMQKREKNDTFWDHIRYWSREEFRCRCGEYHVPYCDGFPVEPDQMLVELLDDIRHEMGAPAYRSSGIRCRQHNVDSGGVEGSRHMSGKAMDFRIDGVDARKVCDFAGRDPRTNYTYVIGDGPYIHVDVK